MHLLFNPDFSSFIIYKTIIYKNVAEVWRYSKQYFIIIESVKY